MLLLWRASAAEAAAKGNSCWSTLDREGKQRGAAWLGNSKASVAQEHLAASLAWQLWPCVHSHRGWGCAATYCYCCCSCSSSSSRFQCTPPPCDAAACMTKPTVLPKQAVGGSFVQKMGQNLWPRPAQQGCQQQSACFTSVRAMCDHTLSWQGLTWQGLGLTSLYKQMHQTLTVLCCACAA